MEPAVGPVTELIKCSIPFLKRQIDYMVHCKRKFNQLKEKVEELERIRNDVQLKVEAARRNVESIHQVVQAWLVKVEKETTRDGEDQTVLRLVMNGEAVNMINTKCWCSCGSGTRYNLGRKAEKKMLLLDELLKEGKEFGDNVSSPLVVDLNPMSINDQDDFEPFASRERLREEIMVALRDDGINIIGVYGMGGVGKTTLVTQVYDQVMKKEKNLFFDEVVMTTVSQNLDPMRKIQNDLADMLGLKQMKEADNPLRRANLLHVRLKQKNTLLILDDLWTSDLDLFQVGIPCGGNHDKVCKVIITTRRLEVCTMLDSQKFINVTVLSEADSWKLFRKNVGDLADSSDELGMTARKIAKECGGLPVALVTLGRGLRSKEKHVWDDTLRELRNSKITSIGGMEPKVFTSIKVSYHFLDRDIYKRSFLLCCLFPEDHQITISELMAYVVGDDTMFVDDDVRLKEMTDKIRTVLDKLVDSCLLLRKDLGDGRYTVSMHDMIRDAAINIASHHQEGNWFLVRAGSGLKRWPGNSLQLTSSSGTSKCLRRLSLMKNEITVLPNEPPELPHLLSLSLYANESLKEIPDSFFQEMGALATLDLRNTGISSLPSSLSLLLNLKTLYLDGCKFNQSTDISVIGKLTKLELLSLRYSGLHGLPEEIKYLTNLRLLDLEGNNGFTIPKNVISSLSRLEYLNTLDCEIKWDVEELEDGNIASLTEVASLPFLYGLTLNFRYYMKEFSISFTDAMDIMMRRKNHNKEDSTKNVCDVDVSHPVLPSIKVLIQRVEVLQLGRCLGLESVGQLGVNFNNFKKLYLLYCIELENIMSFAAADQADIPRALSSPDGCFEKLEHIHIYYCDKLRYLFSSSTAKNLQNMKTLKIYNCRSLVTLIASERIMVNHGKVDDQLLLKIFPNLKYLCIHKCENLKQLWNIGTKEDDDDNQMPMTEESSSVLDFPYLEYLEVVECKKLKGIHLTHQCTQQLKEVVGDGGEWFEQVLEWENPTDKLQMRSLFFYADFPASYRCSKKDKSLDIISAHYMVSVFNLNLVKKVPDMKILNVVDCGGLKDVFNLEEIAGTSTTLNIKEASSEFTFPELNKIKLENLPILENIWKGYIPSVRCFKDLQSLEVCGCHKLSYLFSLSMARNLRRLRQLIILDCSSMVKLVTSDDDQKIVCDDEDNQPLLTISPYLESLVIEMCKNLKQLWDIGENLTKDQDGNVDDDDQLGMTGRASVLDLPYLKNLRILQCENLKRIHLTHQCTQQLKEIEGDSEEWFKELEWENSNDKLSMQSLFKIGKAGETGRRRW